jgi:addiction module HigA family antidote
MQTLPLTVSYILENEFMGPLNINDRNLAEGIGLAPLSVNQIINNRRKITPDFAIRLSKFFGTSAEFWLNLQTIYDLKIALVKKGAVYNNIKPFVYAQNTELFETVCA